MFDLFCQFTSVFINKVKHLLV